MKSFSLRSVDPIFLLKLGPALVMILFGISQLMSPGMWLPFIPEWVITNVPLPATTIMKIHAIVNICLGLLLLSGWKAGIVIPVVILWFISILPFAFMVDWTLALRDSSIILSLVALLALM